MPVQTGIQPPPEARQGTTRPFLGIKYFMVDSEIFSDYHTVSLSTRGERVKLGVRTNLEEWDMKRFLLAMLLCSFMASAAHAAAENVSVAVNEGASDYWKSTDQENRPSIKKYFSRKENDPDSRIRKLDTISVTLQQVFLDDLGGDKRDNSLAIIVKCQELNAGNHISFSKGVPGDGRVVFFSPDVKEKQFLNFSQMPIYGPITYNGGPLMLDIYIIRLKNEKGEINKGLMNLLANWGRIVFPPASPFLEYFNQLGTAILNSPNNEIVFRYTMTLYPDDGYQPLKNGIIEAGDYFFVRQKERGTITPWDTLCLDEGSGRLYKRNGQEAEPGQTQQREEQASLCKYHMREDEKKMFKDGTYLSIQINKGYDSIALDLIQDTYTQFLNRIDDQKGTQIVSQDRITKDFNRAVLRTEHFAEAKSIIAEHRKGNPINQAKLIRVLNKLIDSIKIENKFDENKQTADDKPPVFSTDQIDYLLHELTQLRGKVKDGKTLTRESLEAESKVKIKSTNKLTLDEFLQDVKNAQSQTDKKDASTDVKTQ